MGYLLQQPSEDVRHLARGTYCQDPLWRELVLPVLHRGSLAVGMVHFPLKLFDSQLE